MGFWTTTAGRIDRWGRGVGDAYGERMLPFWRWQAERNRTRFVDKHIAVTGSCGKTTTTMLTGRLFADQVPTKTGLDENTERPCLRTVRRLKAPIDYVVQETSEFPFGTLATVARVLRPDCVIVTSVGLDHASAFRTRESVATEIATLTGHCPLVCVNADSEGVEALVASAPGRVVLFGTVAQAHVRAENVVSALPGRLAFDLVIDGTRRRVTTRFIGTLMLTNVLGALACVYANGLDMDRAVATLATIEPARGRMSVHPAPQGATVVLDTIKAPLWSAKMLVEDSPRMVAGRRVFVLGALSDTGSGSSSTRYRQMLQAAAEASDFVIGFGEAQGQALKLADRLGRDRVGAAGSLLDTVRLLKERPAEMIIVKGNDLRAQQDAFLAALQAGSP